MPARKPNSQNLTAFTWTRALGAWRHTPGAGGRALASPQHARAKKIATSRAQPPLVQILGDIDHADFRDACELLQGTAQIADTSTSSAEVIIIAQSRPGLLPHSQIDKLRRTSPLAGIIALAGTWCEGEPRTGRPWSGVDRLYWYEFAAWWRRQLAARAAGRCPEWSQPAAGGLRISDCGLQVADTKPKGLAQVCAQNRETSAALADVLHCAGYATFQQRMDVRRTTQFGATIGIWEGGQFGDRETESLNAFCESLGADRAPVIAILDFPRRDRVDVALQCGASAVLGKPWLNADLLVTIELLVNQANRRAAA